MRRLLIFCDGTWNKETASTPTNVVVSAQAVLPVGSDGVDQIIYYNEGVGTTYVIDPKIEADVEGAFGWGLFDKIADAYRFLVFNYEPGDEIYIFGFSRGAFTARSLGGLIRKCGIIPKEMSHVIGEAYAFYRREDVKPDEAPAQRFRAEHSPNTIMKDLDRTWRRKNGFSIPNLPNFTIRYIGVWDTVGELGIPNHFLISKFVNAKYGFHDLLLSTTVFSARQALALDETRTEFSPTPWKNIADLNKIEGRDGNYLQLWYPGDHGSVGGGGDIRGLSNATLAWVVDGAVQRGVELKPGTMAGWTSSVDPLVSLHNSTKPLGFADRHLYGHGSRKGPTEPAQLGPTVKTRLAHKARGWSPYRPESLADLIAAHPEVLKT